MQTSTTQALEKTGCEPEIRPTLNVVIAYEDFATGKHAKETYDYLIHQLGHDFEFYNQMWKFDVLGIPKMREMAVKDAAASDLIIVSTHGIGELPAAVRLWIDEWVENKGHARALITLVDRPKDLLNEDPAIRSYLQEAARRAKVDFFAQPDDWPDREEDFTVEQISERAQKTSVIVADFIHHNANATARWGIND
ncbi:MAG TPA: hypothetical protein VFC07_08970 [Verrucomicrobiae bacterium]|nr:hypothetical protein [Verrucomicrobiae bacterium]